MEELINRRKILDVEILRGRILKVWEELDPRVMDKPFSEWFK